MKRTKINQDLINLLAARSALLSHALRRLPVDLRIEVIGDGESMLAINAGEEAIASLILLDDNGWVLNADGQIIDDAEEAADWLAATCDVALMIMTPDHESNGDEFWEQDAAPDMGVDERWIVGEMEGERLLDEWSKIEGWEDGDPRAPHPIHHYPLGGDGVDTPHALLYARARWSSELGAWEGVIYREGFLEPRGPWGVLGAVDDDDSKACGLAYEAIGEAHRDIGNGPFAPSTVDEWLELAVEDGRLFF